MKLYHFPMSSNARKALMTAMILDIDLEIEVVDLTSGAHRTPRFLNLNPNGMVPVLVDNDFVLWESNAIMTYLADSKPGNTLYPADRRLRADVDRWMYWSSSHWNPAISILSYENWLKSMLGIGSADPDQVKRGESLLAKFGTVLDAQLASRPFVTGEDLTLADIAAAVPLMYAGPARLSIESFKNLMKWFESIQELDAWKESGL